MPRILGVEIPDSKPTWVSLTYIFGVGRTTALQAIKEAGVTPTKRAKELTEEEITKLAQAIQRLCVVEGELRRQISQNISRLIEIGCYRGSRHKRGLPVRGQRTRTNARTRKGPKKTVAGKKSVKERR